MYINIEFRIFAIQIFLFIDCEEVVIHMMTYTLDLTVFYLQRIYSEREKNKQLFDKWIDAYFAKTRDDSGDQVRKLRHLSIRADWLKRNDLS